MTVSNKDEKRYESVWCASGFTHGVPYVLDYAGATAHGPIAAAPATLAVYQMIGVPQGPTTTVAGWYPFQTKGICEAYIDGTSDVADGDWIEVINGGTSFIVDSTTTRSTSSVGVALEAQASATPALCQVCLTGERVIVAGS
jgi:hypothetical protein